MNYSSKEILEEDLIPVLFSKQKSKCASLTLAVYEIGFSHLIAPWQYKHFVGEQVEKCQLLSLDVYEVGFSHLITLWPYIHFVSEQVFLKNFLQLISDSEDEC